MNTKEDILNEFKFILEDQFEIDKDRVTFDAKLYEDLDLDSIDAIDMIVFIQKKIGKKVQPEDFKSVTTVGDVVDVIANMLEIK